MKNLIQLTTVLFLLIQINGYSQTKNPEAISKKQDTVLKKQDKKNEINAKELKKFVGKYFLAEGDFNLEVVMENDKMFIISPFSKDLLILKNETTLREITRGVDLELIKGDKNELKFTQNGYETTIKRVVDSKKEK
jgi:hypothetical protein